MFNNFMRVLKKGKSEEVLLYHLWEDIYEMYKNESVLETPIEQPSIEWIKTTDWYKDGGYKEIRKALYPSLGDQLDMLYKKDWDGWRNVVTEIKEKWPKPEEI